METEVRQRKNKVNKSKNDTKIDHAVDNEDTSKINLKHSSDEIINDINKTDSKRKNKVEQKLSMKNGLQSELKTLSSDLKQKQFHKINVTFEFDLISFGLFIAAFVTRFVNLNHPNNIVFDELHYGKYVALYMKRTFFFDQHPPLGKQMIAGAAYLAGFSGNYTFSRIGTEYNENVPIFWMRTVPAFCGSLIVPIVYKLLLQLKLSHWTALLGGILVLLDNALLTQSRFVLMEPMLLLFSLLGLLCLLKFHELSNRVSKPQYGMGIIDRIRDLWKMVCYAIFAAVFFTCALCVKYVGFYSCCLGVMIGLRQLWNKLSDRSINGFAILLQFCLRLLLFTCIPFIVYISIFWIHLNVLNKAGPHDCAMTSAFQASLEGGLASITKGQPLVIAHGSQVTLRHTHGRTCWLHSHAHVYPVRYPDNRGSSHQQQVTCYSFKDVNNWWIVKRPKKSNLVVGSDTSEIDAIKHGDEIQLVHGITSRALNSHDVASAMTPQCQEVSCYIDYNVSMSAQNLWRIEILNRDQEGKIWHTIKSQVRLIHVGTNAALRFSGRQLPDWGFNQHEVVADRIHDQLDTIWNVEEHRYTKTADQRERERQMVNAEMIPTKPTTLSFWEKFFELQHKMLWHQSNADSVTTHMYGSEPLDWPFMSKGIAYWVDRETNAQIHLIGNIIIWYSSTIGVFVYITLLCFYLLRRRRQCYDINDEIWQIFCNCGEIFLTGYLIHFLPYFFVEKTLFLHNYLPALIYKILLLCSLFDHLFRVLDQNEKLNNMKMILRFGICLWLFGIFYVFKRFLLLSYGLVTMNRKTVTSDDIIGLRWRDTWDFILHKDLA